MTKSADDVAISGERVAVKHSAGLGSAGRTTLKSLALLLVCGSLATTVLANEMKPFDSKPSHPWNRLYAALFAHTSAESSPAPRTPAQWTQADPDIAGQGYSDLLVELDGFLNSRAEKLVTSPVARALLQSAIWATFDEVSDPRGAERAARNAVALRCAEIMRRIALSDAEVAALPDNYAVTVKQAAYPAAFDNAHPDQPYLPPDLMDANGPWVMMGGETLEPAAIQHVQLVRGRSAFYVFIRLPAGRAATLAYLRELANFPQPYVWNETYASYPYARAPVKLNPGLPQFPQGTQVALLRRMLLPRTDGGLAVTAITESLQMRVYARDPAHAQWGAPGNQQFSMFRMVPEKVIADSGGLVATPILEFEPRRLFAELSAIDRGGCSNCHAPVGVHSLHTYTRMMGPPRTTPWFEVSQAEAQDRNIVRWKMRDFSWGLLQGFQAATSANTPSASRQTPLR